LRTKNKKSVISGDLIPGLTSNPLEALKQALRTAQDGNLTCVTFGNHEADVSGGLLMELKNGHDKSTSDDVLWMKQVVLHAFAASFRSL
jgi:hypothetical protein